MNTIPLSPGARQSDPETSHAGERRSRLRATSQAARLLWMYRYADRTDDEAAVLAGLTKHPGCCWWKRTSDLRAAAMITPTGQERESSITGEMRMVCSITEAGRALLATWEAPEL